MDGRRPVGIMYTNTHVEDPAKYDDYNNWYHAVHFPDVTEPGIFVNATMFHNAREPKRPDEGRFLAFYETYWQDVNAAYAEFTKTVAKLRAEYRIHPATGKGFFGVYKTLTTVFSTDRRKRSQSLVAVRLDCKDPARVDDLKKWYCEVHVPEVVGQGLFHTGTFGEMIDGEAYASRQDSGMPRWIAVYESDLGDPQDIAEELQRRLPEARPPDYVDIVMTSMFYRHTP